MRILLACYLLASCTQASPPPPTGGPSARTTGAASTSSDAPADDCTLATPLVPGVPGSPGHWVRSAINPNGASELATLMRALADDLRAARAALVGGARPAHMWARHRKMRCAWPTEVGDRNPAFDAMAQTYLAAVRELESAPSPAAYDSVVKACRACHEVTCGGPLQVIDGLARGK